MFKKKNKPTLLTRTKAICLSIGELTPYKINTLLSIREKYITIANNMTYACFQDDFLTLQDYSPEDITKKFTKKSKKEAP